MRVRLAFLSEYNDAIKTLGVEASEEFRRVMDEWHAQNQDATVAEARDFCIVAAANVSERFAGPSSEIAAQLFDEVCEEEGIDATASLLDELVNMDMVEDAAHYNAGRLVGGDWDGFVEAEARTVDNNVHRAAYDTMKKSCKDNHVQWARVPSGRETCGYCFMLASRGFVYVSEDTAKAGSHVGCDCVVVPGKHGSTEVEGYDPDALYERWKECEAAAGSSDFRDIIKEVETRDWGWVWKGIAKPAERFSDRVYSGTLFADSLEETWTSDPKETIDGIYDRLRDAKVPEAADVWGRVFPNVTIETAESVRRKGSWYDPGTGVVTLEKCDRKFEPEYGRTPLSVLFHEVGHATDDYLRWGVFGGRDHSVTFDGSLGKAIKSDWDAMLRAYMADTGLKKKSATYALFDQMRLDYPIEARASVSDWLEAVTGERMPLGAGHGAAYWKRNGSDSDSVMRELSVEAFAELFEACMANHGAWDMMDKYFPSATKWFADTMKEYSK